MAEINYKVFEVENSPFREEYHGRKMPLNVRLEEDARKLLKEHFEGIYGKRKEDEAMTKGMTKLCHDYLETLCLERKNFNHLEAIMLIPKTIDLDELDSKSEIIAFINTKYDFENFYHHVRSFEGNYELTYELKEFNQGNFYQVLEMLKNTKESCLFKTKKEDLKSFETFKAKQNELYPRLDLDDCYFVRFPLNNFMDNQKDGVNHHYKIWKNNHMGALVFHFLNENIELLLLIDWYYLAEVRQEVKIDFQFAPENFFVESLMESGDDKLIEALDGVMAQDFRQRKLKEMKSEYSRRLNIIDKLLQD